MNAESTVIDLSPDRLAQLRKHLEGLSVRLHAAKLDVITDVLLDVAGPLGPLGAQALWVAQPVLGLMLPPDQIDGLARVLESPAGIDWLREVMIGLSHTDGQA